MDLMVSHCIEKMFSCRWKTNMKPSHFSFDSYVFVTFRHFSCGTVSKNTDFYARQKMYSVQLCIVSALLIFGNGVKIVVGVGESDTTDWCEFQIAFLDLNHSIVCGSKVFVNAHGSARFEFDSFQKSINLSDGCIVVHKRLQLISKCKYK